MKLESEDLPPSYDRGERFAPLRRRQDGRGVVGIHYETVREVEGRPRFPYGAPTEVRERPAGGAEPPYPAGEGPKSRDSRSLLPRGKQHLQPQAGPDDPAPRPPSPTERTGPP